MQKISGILPSTPRIASVDMNESSALRPGGPSFGRPVGVSELSSREDVKISTAQIAGQRHDELLGLRSKDLRDAESVKRLSDSFFMKRVQPEIEDGQRDSKIDDQAELPADQVSSVPRLFRDPESGEMVDRAVLPPGSYLNISA
ncbi:MAG: hypothetical protein IPK68_05915 [Bdellovibrionales bacterium]|nr:hypothetical protein [Bdellovibrionales bacterium]